MLRSTIPILLLLLPLILAGGCDGENCTSHDQTFCTDGITYWVNSCGDFEEILEHCLLECDGDHLVCKEGECLHDASCEDNDPCTDDACVQYYCRNTDNQAFCDDGNQCTLNDVCAEGTCAGTWDSCDDQIACTADSCQAATGCEHAADDLLCDDGDGCTVDACDSLQDCFYTDACDANATCLNRSCVCDTGFRGDGVSCFDIDECVEQSYDCDPNASCSNTPGGYSCSCNLPYTGDGFTCSLCGNSECDGDETLQTCPADCDLDIVIVVEDSVLTGIASALATYQQDLRDAGHASRVIEWTSGTASDLRDLLVNARNDYAIEGAFLLGHLPSAWYECECWQDFDPMHEEYPCDIYLMDLDANWTDADNDGIYDGHSSLSADIFVSRVTGNASLIGDYLSKVHDYRTNGSLLPQQAFIFMDDDWAIWYGNYGLDSIYSTCDLLYDTNQTTRANFLSRVEGAGAEYVYQWIHASPQELYITHQGDYQIVSLSDVISGDHRASFVNLFNCSGARYTDPLGSLSQTYMTRTSYGLADIGSTKTGGVYNPEVFHGNLASGSTWGESYRRWYNAEGVIDDEWFLGIVIAGDPLLTIQGNTRGLIGSLPSKEWSEDDLDRMSRTLIEHARRLELGSFAGYRARNPQFFRD